jgi:hypothetical protein
MMITTPTTTPPGSPRNKEVEVDEVREADEVRQADEVREVEGVFDSPDTEGEAGIQLSYPEELLLKKPAKRVRKIKKDKKEQGEV